MENCGMEKSDYADTRLVTRLPHLDIKVLHRRQSEGEEQQLLIMVRAVPPSELFERFLEAANPLLLWSQLMRAVWSTSLTGGRSQDAPYDGAEPKRSGENGAL
jgi:hypothetical protein